MHGGNLDLLTERYGIEAGNIIDFSSNLNPFGPPPEIQEVLDSEWPRIARYPDPGYKKLREELSKLHNLSPDNIVPGNGTSELIQWSARIIPHPKALVLEPAFSEYARAVNSAEGEIEHEIPKEQENFNHTLSRVVVNDGSSRSKVNLVYLANPGNPTGNLIPRLELKSWISFWMKKEPQVLFVIDESFLPFAGGEEDATVTDYAVQTNQVIVLRSLTKILAIPGLRLGYAVCHSSAAKIFDLLLPTWHVNGLAQAVGENILKFKNFRMESLKAIGGLKETFFENLNRIAELKAYPSVANFILLKILPPQASSLFLAQSFEKKGILVRECGDFTGLEKGRFLRIAVKKEDENNHLISLFKDAL